MKKLLVLTMVLVSYVSYGQTKTEQYCEMLAIGKLFSTKVNITIDFGQAKNIWADSRMKDENGNTRTFNSVMDALNFMAKEGWKLVNAFPITEGGSNVYHYVLKREFDISELK